MHKIAGSSGLKAWLDADLTTLVKEGTTIQHRLPKTPRVNVKNESRLARTFANLTFRGKTCAALDLLTNRCGGGVLHLDQPPTSDDPETLSVREVVTSKHPTGQPASPVSTEPTLQGLTPEVHPLIFDSIDARLICSTALRTSGAAGPSGLDAHAWWRLCTAFKSASISLCQSLAEIAKRLCTSFVDPQGIAPLLASRLIALDKCPGVHPIGIGDTARRIITKAVLVITHGNIQEAVGSLQLSAGPASG